MIQIHSQVDSKKKAKNTILPPMDEVLHSRSGSDTSFHVPKKYTFLQLEAAEATVDRLRVLLREREIEVGKLRAENSTLRQRERKHQKDIEALEQQNEEAPKIISRMRDELVIAKNKLKQYYGQIGEDSRIMRQLHDDRNKTKEQNQKLQQLVDAKNLDERDQLKKQLDQQNQKIVDLQKMYQESEKNLEMVEKNLGSDNRQLRGKVHSLEQEKHLVKEQIVKLQDAIREKEKVISSLSIYRYNAIHRKQEQQCKTCSKREKEVQEQKRKTEILNKLPPLEIIDISASATSVLLRVGCPDLDTWEYSSVSISYSDDPAMAERLQTLVLEKPNLLEDIKIEGLTSGLVYYFCVFAGHEKVFANPSKSISTLVDAIPDAPKISSARAKLSPPAIQILFSPPENTGSAILSYRLYHSTTADFKESYLTFDEPVETIQQRGNFLVFTVSDPQLTVPYYFKASACNIMGEGFKSEVSAETIVDMVPPRPEKPIVKKMSSNSLKISSMNPVPLGSPPTKFKIKMCKMVEVEGDAAHHTEVIQEIMVDQVVSIRNNEFQYTVDSVERGTAYKFAVRAINSQGESDQSEWSDEVDIDLMVPSCGDITVVDVTPETVIIKALPKPNIENPTIKGYRLKWSHNSNMSPLVGQTDILSFGKTNYTISGLDSQKVYYVKGALVGDFEEGEPSKGVYVVPAASIPLPPSPQPQEDQKRDSIKKSADDLAPPAQLRKQSSMGSSLSMNQRYGNMHHGMPAHHDPPVEPNSLYLSADNLAGDKRKTRKQTMNQARKSSDMTRRRSEAKLGTLKGSNNSLSKSGSLPQISQRESLRK